MIFVLTGACPGYERTALAEMIGRTNNVLHPKLTRLNANMGVALVASDDAITRNTKKVADARSFGVDVWSYARLLTYLTRQEQFGGRSIPERTVTVPARLHSASPAFKPPPKPFSERGMKRKL